MDWFDRNRGDFARTCALLTHDVAGRREDAPTSE